MYHLPGLQASIPVLVAWGGGPGRQRTKRREWVDAQLEALAAQMRELDDLERIRRLQIDYGDFLDEGEFDRFGALFAHEGELLLGPLGRAKGPAAIAAMMAHAVGAEVGHTRHLIANPRISLEGDFATARDTWIVYASDGKEPPRVTMVGRHRDRFTREDGEWKFLRREGRVDLPARFVRD